MTGPGQSVDIDPYVVKLARELADQQEAAALGASLADDHPGKIALAAANPPSGWSAYWHPQQELIFYQMDPPVDGSEWNFWKVYPKRGELMPTGTDWYCHECRWPIRFDKPDTSCWYCKGWCGGR